ncbi:hypothetical protein TNIN_238011 [Trichonephila inaurata madagascariensis]|uniref:Uncharacterized protein n=1 Tax=Trichonephila inaurata madagascariensis TaxID=2747483 RepID=A0A8X6WW12_9ARAC|nr:hypothetical protein TNIN_238011 [Trichonephila inaurata madagascariensis]
MSEMETDQVPVSECSRMPIAKAIRTHIIISNGYMDLEGTPDTAENYEMKEVLRAARKETLKKKAELVSELRSLPPCTTFNCTCDAIANHFGPLDNEPSNPKASQDSINSTEIVTTPKNDKIKTKSKNKKRKVKKDSSDDFVFPKKTARPVSPLVSEPVETANSFSDLESEEKQEQVLAESHGAAISYEITSFNLGYR